VPIPTPLPKIRPDISPRQRGGTDSVPIVWVEAMTPPINTPWTRRRIMKATGAATPIWARVGKTPNAAVASPTPVTATIMAPLRPYRSA
jgi:hypothetical protein